MSLIFALKFSVFSDRKRRLSLQQKQPGNAMWGHNNHLLWESYETSVLEGG